MKLSNFLRDEEKRGLAYLGINDDDIEKESHLFYFIRKRAARNLYFQLRDKGLRMDECLYIIGELLSLSSDRVRDLVFRKSK